MESFNPTEKLNQFFKWYAETVVGKPHEDYDQKDFGRDVLGTAKSTTSAYFKGTERKFPKKHWHKLSAILKEHGLPPFEKWEGYKEAPAMEEMNRELLMTRRQRIGHVFEAILELTDISRVALGKKFVGNYLKPEQFINGLLQGKYNTERILPKLYSMKLKLKGRDGIWRANPHYIEATHPTSAKFIPQEGDQLAGLLESPEMLKAAHLKIKEAQKTLSDLEDLTKTLLK